MLKHRVLPKGIIIITILIWLPAGSFRALGQQFNFESYNRSNGLLSNEVDCIRQNSSGFMLFGTPSGLSIFDGAAFSNFDEAKGFHQDLISDIGELPGKEMLLLTGSSRFYRLGRWKLQADSFDAADGLKRAYRTKEGNWILSGYKGVYRWEHGRLHSLNIAPGHVFQGINCVIQWRDSLLVVGKSYEPLQIYNMHSWRLVASSVEKLFVRDLFADDAGRIWIATNGNGVKLLDGASVAGDRIRLAPVPACLLPFSTNEFRSITQDREGNLWLASIGKGLIEYNSRTGAFVHFSTDQGLASNTLYAVFCDREDNIWIGSNRGVQKLAYKNVYSYSAVQGLPADAVLDILPDEKGNILTSGYSGMSFIPGGAVNARAWQPPLQDEYVFSLVQQGGGTFGLSLRKLLELSVAGGRLSARRSIPLPAHFRSMIPLDDDKLLLGGDSSILLVERGRVSVLMKEGVHAVEAMALGRDGFLWTGGLDNSICRYRLIADGRGVVADAQRGIAKMDGRGLAATLDARFVVPVEGPQDYIRCIAEGKRDEVLYGTTHSGLTILGIKAGRIAWKKTIGQANGLSSNYVNALRWVNDSVLLVCTLNGLDKIVFGGPGTAGQTGGGDSFTIRNITDYYKITNAVYNVKPGAAGSYLLATEAGVYSIPSIAVEAPRLEPPPVVISAIHPIDRPDSFIDVSQPVVLAHNNSGLTVSFCCPSFGSGGTIQYTHFLKGGDETNWSLPSASGTVTYAHLPPGNYTFSVQPIIPYGNERVPAAGFNLVVVPAFWQKGSFYVAMIAIVAATLFLLIRRRIRQIRREATLTTRIAETEMMALRAQMNPHFIFNCMNIIDALITGNRNAEAADFLQKFSRVIRLVLENSKEQLVPLQKDLQALTLYTELEAIRFDHQFSYHFDVDPSLLEEKVRIPPLLLQPYVENAIVHGLRNREEPGGRLLVQITKAGESIVAVVEDNGIGRERSAALQAENGKRYEKMGMQVTGKRIAILQQRNKGRIDVRIEDADAGTACGTRVTIKLPRNITFE